MFTKTDNKKYKYLKQLLVALVIVGLLGMYVIPQHFAYGTESNPLSVDFIGFDGNINNPVQSIPVQWGDSLDENQFPDGNAIKADPGWVFSDWVPIGSLDFIQENTLVFANFDYVGEEGSFASMQEGDDPTPPEPTVELFTVTFDFGAGSEAEALVIKDVEEGTLVNSIVPANPSPSSNIFTFTGWNPAINDQTAVDGNRVFTAQWTQKVSGNGVSKTNWNTILGSKEFGFSLPGNAQKLEFGNVSQNGHTFLDFAYLVVDDEGNVTLYFLAFSDNKVFDHKDSFMTYAGIPGKVVGKWDKSDKEMYRAFEVTIPIKDIDILMKDNLLNIVNEGNKPHSISSETLKFTNLFFTEHYIYYDDNPATATLKVTIAQVGVTGVTAQAKPITITGFVFDEGCPLNVKSGTMPKDGKLVLKLYYKRSDESFSFTITGVPGQAEYTGSTITLRDSDAQPISGLLYAITVDDAHPDDRYRIEVTITGDNPSGTDVGVYPQTLAFDKNSLTIWYLSGPKKTPEVTAPEDFTDLFGSWTIIDKALTILANTSPIVVTAATAGKTYDGKALTDGSVTWTGLPDGFTVEATVSGSRTDVGSVPNTIDEGSIVIKDKDGKDVTSFYSNVSRVAGQLTVDPKAVTVVVDNKTKVYGDADPGLTATVTGMVEGETLNYTLVRDSGENVGEYAIVFTAGDNPNYIITQPDNGVFTITPRPVTIKAIDNGKVFGGADPALTADIEGLEGMIFEGAPIFSLEREAGEDVDTYNIAVILAENANPNYTITTEDATFTITPKPILITAVDKSKVYGDDDPALTWIITDGAGAEISVGDDVVVFSLERAPGENVGPYPIVVTTTFENPNYTIETKDGTLTITPKAVTVTIKDAEKTYGADDPDFETVITGLKDGDALDFTFKREEGENVGTYEIDIVMEEGANPNYIIEVNTGELTIIPKKVTLVAQNKTQVYGNEEIPLTAVVTGLEEGDSLNYSLARVPGDVVGDYAISITLGVNPNYIVDTTGAVYTITPRPVTLKADDKSKVYGTSDPALTATLTEGTLVNGDTLNYTVTRAAGEDKGEYVITVNPGSNPNYTVTVEPGTFKITPVIIKVVAENKSKTFGDADPALTAAIVGDVKAGDTIKFTLAREPGENVGEYDIIVTLLDNPNYTVEKEDAVLTINKKAVTLKADDNSKVYGTADPAFTATLTEGSLVNGDTLNYTVARVAGEDKGEYAINITLGSNPNYDVTVEPGEFKITPKEVTLTVLSKTKVYGDDDPALEATAEILVGNDGLDYTLTRDAGEDVASYAINVSLGNNPNYIVTIVNDAVFTITPRPITITADDKSKEYGAAEPALTASVTTGTLVSGDTLDYTVTRVPGEDVKEYVISVTAGSNPNYTVTVAPGTFTITPVIIKVIAENKSKTYGEDDPSLTATIVGTVQDGDTINYTLARVPGETVAGSPYEIMVTLGSNPNYTVTFENAELTITKRGIEIGPLDPSKPTDPDPDDPDPTDPETIDPATFLTVADMKHFTKVYGDSDPALGVIEALIQKSVRAWIAENYKDVPGVDPTDFTVTVKNRAEGESVDVYPYDFEVTATGNYELTYTIEASLTIVPAELTIETASQTFLFNGNPHTNPTTTVTGLKLEDTYTGLAADGEITYPGTEDNPISYANALFTSENGDLEHNYNVTFIIGKLTVEAEGIFVDLTSAVVGADDRFQKVYGDADPALEDVEKAIQDMVSEQLVAQGLSGDDVVVSVTGRAAGENVVGSPYAYTITYSFVGVGYSFNKDPELAADLTIVGRPITITAASDDKVYDGDPLTNSGYTFDETALVNGETVVSVIVTGTQTHVLRDGDGNIIGTTNKASNAIIMSEDGETDVTSNYAITYEHGLIVINPLILEITVLDQTLRQGSPIPTRFDLTAIKFIDGEDYTVLKGSAEYKTDYTPRARAGEVFPVEVSGFTAQDYEIVYVPGKINVIARGGTGGGGGDGGGGDDGTGGTTGTGGGEPGEPIEVTTTINGMETPLAGTVVPINSERPPLASFASWALLNLILTIITVLIAIALFVTYFMNRRKKEDEDELGQDNEAEFKEEEEREKVRKRLLVRVFSIVAAVVAIILFVITQDMTLPVGFVDIWTIWHIVIVAAAVVIAFLGRKKSEEEEDDEAIENETV